MFEELLAAPRFSRVETWGRFLLGHTSHGSSLYEADSEVAHFDLEGRWQRATVLGRTFLRGLDGVVLERFAAGPHSDLRLEPPRLAHEAVVGLVTRAQAAAPLSDWTVERLLAEQGRFLEAYRPVGIVPPDRYQSLIVQATHGCAWNGCLFCSLYKGQRHRVVPADELRAHVRRVKTFVGSGLALKRGVFLGEANALALPMPALHATFDVLSDELPTLAHDVSSFIDAFDDYRTHAEFSQLAARGLTRVFIGVESGDEATLALLGKPSSVAGVARLVEALKVGGVTVGVIFLAGLGGQHVEASASLCASLPLDEGDIVYVSPLVVQPSGPLAAKLARRRLLLPREDVDAEARTLRVVLRNRAKVARYDVRRWVYM